MHHASKYCESLGYIWIETKLMIPSNNDIGKWLSVEEFRRNYPVTASEPAARRYMEAKPAYLRPSMWRYMYEPLSP
jgi:hypothetical protein